MLRIKSLTINILHCVVFVQFLVALIFGGACRKKSIRPEPRDSLKGTITISGAFALYPLTLKWAEEFRKIHPRVRIDISAGGAGKGIADVLAGMVDMAMVSRQISMFEQERGAWAVAVARDAVVGTYNSANPYVTQIRQKGLSKRTLEKIFITQEIKFWQDCPGFEGPTYPLKLYTRSDACGAAEIWAGFFGKHQEDLKGTGVFGDPGIAEAVRNDPGSIGYNNLIYAYDIDTRKTIDQLSVIPLDLNENGIVEPEEDFYGTLDEILKAVTDGRYPSPPARALYLVTRNKPTNPVVREFLLWILTEGQKYVELSGYAKLDRITLEEEISKLQ